MIFSVVSGLEPRKTPISWFRFEHLIQKVARDCDRKILHRKECLQVAKLFHISKKDLNAVLDHCNLWCHSLLPTLATRHCVC